MTSFTARISREKFVDKYGGLYEHSPWVAETCYERALGVNGDALLMLFAQCVDASPPDIKIQLVRSHPDLAGRASMRRELTVESCREQSSAGINECSPEEYDQFAALNDAYKSKFGFPFVLAVRNRSRIEILAEFRRRLGNDIDDELVTALSEIHEIARLRFIELEGASEL